MSIVQAPAIHDVFRGSFPGLTPIATDADRPRLLKRLRRGDGFRESNIVPYTHRPFDSRWMYVDRAAEAEYFEHLARDVQFLGVGTNGDTPLVTRRAAANVDAPLQLFPLTPANLTPDAAEYVRRTGVAESDLFHHAIAMLAAGRKTAQIPLPDDKSAIRESALLGYRFAALFSEHEPLVAASPQEQALRLFGVPARIGKEARMLRGSALCVTGDAVVTRIYKGEELAALADLGGDEAVSILGRKTCDVHLNEKALWRNVPLEVWSYTHHGVPLLRAWLRDRHAEVLGRALLREEVSQFSTAVRRIAALLMLRPALARSAMS